MKNFLDDELAALIGTDGAKVIGLGVIAFKNGREVYSFFGGRRHVNPDKKITRQTLLRAASVSKIFTAIAIMQLVEGGKLNLSDDVNKFDFDLRNPNFPNAPITIEMLLDHTSSLRDEENFSVREPGKFFCYCNLGYCVLATIIERVTGERFDRYQHNHIFAPLNLNCGYVVADLSEKSFANLGTIYRKNAAQIDDYKIQPPKNFAANYRIGTDAGIFAPQGGLRISFDDLGKFLQMLMNRGVHDGQRIISEKSFDAIISAHWTFDGTNGDTYGGVMENYGLGTYKIFGDGKARLCKNFAIDFVGHSGEAYGLISGLYFVPGTRDGVLFMANGTAFDADDPRSCGKFSCGYIWEENIMDPVCRKIFAQS